MQRRDLDSILDAALDDLDDNDEASGSFERHVHEQTPPGAIDACGNQYLGSNSNDTHNSTTALGVPYSLDYLSRCERETLAKGRRTSAPMYGPEPPPPIDFDTAAALMNDKSVRKEMEQFQKELENSDFGDDLNDFFQSMSQAFPGIDKNAGDMEFDMVMKNMLRMANNDGDMLDDGCASSPDNMKASSSISSVTARCNNQSTDKSPPSLATAFTKTKQNDKSKVPPPQRDNALNKTEEVVEPNVDESIHRLLEGINSASSSSANHQSNAQHPFFPPGMENMDPSQFEQFSEEIMSTLMSEFEQMGHKQDSNIVVDNVMKQLLDRDIMYEPMKEVCTRFPKYLAQHKDALSPEEYQRYGTQYQYFQRIVHIYETEPNNFDRLMELMQDIQEYGQPPVEIIKELAPELEFDSEGMPIMNPAGGVGGMPPFLPGMMGNEQCCIS